MSEMKSSKEMKSLCNVMRKMMESGLVPSAFDENVNPVVMRAVIEEAQKNMPIAEGIRIKTEIVNGVEMESLTPENERKDAVIFYAHGGGLICGNCFSSRGYASMLAKESNMTVFTASYGLAPEHPFPAATEDTFTVYKEIVKRYPDRAIFVTGESGGGYLTLVTAIMAKDRNVRMPNGLIPFSPLVDLSGTLVRVGDKDFTVKPNGLNALRKCYCPDLSGEELKNPLISPIFADFTNFPPIKIVWDLTETLAIDSEEIVLKAIKAGVEVEAKGYPDCFHAFATAGYGTPETIEVLKDTVSFIERNI